MTSFLASKAGAAALVFTFAAAGAIFAPSAHAQGPSPEARAVIQSLSDEERQKFFALPGAEKRAFIQKKLQEKGGGQARDGGEKAKSGFKGGFGGKTKGKGKRGFPPPLVELADVTREALVQTYPVTGRLIASNKSTIAATIRGRVAEVLVQVGDRVKKGDVLLRLDVDRLKLEADLKAAEVIQARAKWHNAQAQVKFLEQELRRLERLKKSAAFSQARYEDKQQEIVKARTAVDENAALLQRARASRDLARIDLKDAEIVAPFGGAITVRHTSAGAYISAGNPVITILDDQNLEIEADVPSIRLAGVAPDATIDVHLNEKTVVKAKVRAVIPDENPLARTQAVRLTSDFGGQGANVVPNQSVVLMVPRGERREVTAVPKDAVVERQNGKAVFVFAAGSVRPALVQIGQAFGSKFEILSGIEPGQKVVVRGNELLRPGQRVRLASRGDPGGPGGFGGGGGKGGGIVSTLSPEERQKFFAMSAEERREFIAKKRATGGGAQAATVDAPPAGGGGGFGGRGGGGKGGGIVSSLSPEEREKFFALSPEERRAFIMKKRQEMQGQ